MIIHKIYEKTYKEFKAFFEKSGIKAYKPKDCELNSHNDIIIDFDAIYAQALRELNILYKQNENEQIDESLWTDKFFRFFVVGRLFFYNNYVQTHKIYLSKNNLEFVTPEILDYMELGDKDFKDFYGIEPLKLEDHPMSVPENNTIPEDLKFNLFDIYYKLTIKFMVESLDFSKIENTEYRLEYKIGDKNFYIQTTTGLSGYFNFNRFTPKNAIRVNEYITLVSKDEVYDDNIVKILNQYFRIWGGYKLLTRGAQMQQTSYIERLKGDFKFNMVEDIGWML